MACLDVLCGRITVEFTLGLNKMTDDEHAFYLGKLLVNFQSLEFALRAYLQDQPDARPFELPDGTDIYLCPVGAELPENEFTSYDTLGQLIKKYNDKIRARGGAPIDDTLVELRDALAHGRVAAKGDIDNDHLLKFSKPREGKVQVTFNQEMSVEWFKEQYKRVNGALHSVAAS